MQSHSKSMLQYKPPYVYTLYTMYIENAQGKGSVENRWLAPCLMVFIAHLIGGKFFFIGQSVCIHKIA